MNEESPGYAKRLEKRLRPVSENARKEAFAVGMSILVKENGKLYYHHPDGTKTLHIKNKKP